MTNNLTFIRRETRFCFLQKDEVINNYMELFGAFLYLLVTSTTFLTTHLTSTLSDYTLIENILKYLAKHKLKLTCE